MSEAPLIVIARDGRLKLTARSKTGVPYNLTGKDMLFRMRPDVGTALELTHLAGIDISGAATGVMRPNWTAAQISDWVNEGAVTCYLSVFNPDDTIFLQKSFTLRVSY